MVVITEQGFNSYLLRVYLKGEEENKYHKIKVQNPDSFLAKLE